LQCSYFAVAVAASTGRRKLYHVDQAISLLIKPAILLSELVDLAG
jgi:hypothetical protein